MEENGRIFSGRASAGRTTYFVDVRQAVNYRYYITLTESRRVSDTGFDQNRIFIFEEHLDELSEVLSSAFSELQRAVDQRGPLPDGQAGSKYERSGKSWTEEEEDTLRKEFEKKTSRDDIAEKLQRSSYAVTLRLEKLGLVERPPQDGPAADSA